MNLKITKEIKLTSDEVKNIVIKYLNLTYNLTGIFDIDFLHTQNPHQEIKFNGAKIRISENE